jgi:hypothetical protein
MKKLFIILVILFLVSFVDAEVLNRPLIEIGPKASLYIDNDTQFSIGVESVFNPLKSFGIRLDLAEVIFNGTKFYLNREGSLDALIYIPIGGMQSYIHSGLSLRVRETGADTRTDFLIRAGLGLNYTLNRRTDLFVEPGIIIEGNGETNTIFRLSFGARFGIFR